MLQLQPAQTLSFQPPYSQVQQCQLTLTNTSTTEDLAFKVKTTAPKQYCVRPNAGLVRRGQQRSITVLLQPMKDPIPADFKCRDKFLVLSLPVAASVSSELDETQANFWQVVETAAGQTPQEVKLRVHLAPSTSSIPPTVPEESVSVSAAVPVPQKPPSQPTKVAASSPIPPIVDGEKSKTAPSSPPKSMVAPALAKEVMSPLPRTTQSTGTATTQSGDAGGEKQQQLQEEVSRLKELCDKYQRELMSTRAELRQRLTSSPSAGATGDSSSPNKEKSEGKKVQVSSPPEGLYPLSIVIMVALCAFLFGYLFF